MQMLMVQIQNISKNGLIIFRRHVRCCVKPCRVWAISIPFRF